MRAVVFTGDGVTVDDVPEPQVLEPDDVVVRVSLTSICGSDLHLLDGKTPGMRPGSVIGHEFVGVVEESGEVSKVARGTRVLGSFLIACGLCDACAARRFNHCRERRALGLGTLTGDLDGAQAELVRVPHAGVNLKPLTGSLTDLADEQALFAGDILATGFYAAHLSEAARGERAVVVGAGPIGLLTALALRDKGTSVLLLDTDDGRVDAAQKLGFAALKPGDDAGTDARAALGGEIHVAVDAVGAIPALKTAMRCVRDGGRVVVVGVYGAERYELPVGMVWIRGLDLRFSGMANVHAHWEEALRRTALGDIDPARLITHRLALEEAEEGYRLFAAREATKVVLRP
jgi:threonine dehydrogenase-like Zn-dependent dehydrogenase